jgi:predicted GNAT family N-acyltransferase
MSFRTETITAGAARPLRHSVLRPEQPAESVIYPLDDAADALHVGAFDGERLVAVASLYRESPEGSADKAMWRLRGMATAPDARRRGHGDRLLRACFEHVLACGGGTIWCNARTTASDFYFALGFGVEGEPFELPGIGRHYVMTRSVR